MHFIYEYCLNLYIKVAWKKNNRKKQRRLRWDFDRNVSIVDVF